jgi:uncharacterized membrane protein
MLAEIFNQYHPNVKATICFLRMLGVKVNGTTVDESLQNHPDWPSLLCVSDVLTNWNIPNAGGKMEVNDIDSLPIPFIAYTHNIESPLAVVQSISPKEIVCYSQDFKKPKVLQREEFIKNWTGIYLIAEPGEASGEKNYKANRRKQLLQQLLPISLLALLAGVSFYLSAARANWSSGWPFALSMYPIYLLGVVVTSLLLWYEIDRNNPLLQKVCTGIAKGNCNAILTGKQSKLFSWLSWSEVGFFWFTGGFLILLFGAAPANIYFLGWLNLLALPYPAFSVYYQWRVAKQWCVLCLAVQVLLIAGAVLFVTSQRINEFSFLSVSFLTLLLVFYAAPVIAWYVIKPYLLQLQEAKTTSREYLRLKFNTQIFDTLLTKQKQITLPTEELGIEIGNPNAKHTIIKVCNPYCGPCAKAHPEIEKLLEDNVNLKVQIIFAVSSDTTNPSYKPVSHMLAIAELGNSEVVRKSLDEWYLKTVKDYSNFANKYPMNGEIAKQQGKIEAMDKWCNAMGIQFTPTFFVNGYQLPDVYSISDLKYFLLDSSTEN